MFWRTLLPSFLWTIIEPSLRFRNASLPKEASQPSTPLGDDAAAKSTALVRVVYSAHSEIVMPSGRSLARARLLHDILTTRHICCCWADTGWWMIEWYQLSYQIISPSARVRPRRHHPRHTKRYGRTPSASHTTTISLSIQRTRRRWSRPQPQGGDLQRSAISHHYHSQLGASTSSRSFRGGFLRWVQRDAVRGGGGDAAAAAAAVAVRNETHCVRKSDTMCHRDFAVRPLKHAIFGSAATDRHLRIYSWRRQHTCRRRRCRFALQMRINS